MSVTPNLFFRETKIDDHVYESSSLSSLKPLSLQIHNGKYPSEITSQPTFRTNLHYKNISPTTSNFLFDRLGLFYFSFAFSCLRKLCVLCIQGRKQHFTPVSRWFGKVVLTLKYRFVFAGDAWPGNRRDLRHKQVRKCYIVLGFIFLSVVLDCENEERDEFS